MSAVDPEQQSGATSLPWADRYPSARRLGGDGLSATYEARHPGLGTRVLLRAFSPLEDASRELLSRVVLAHAQATHPSLRPYLDGDLASPAPWLVTEGGADRNVEHALASGPDDRPTRVAWAAQFLGALSALHAQGVVHGGPSPARLVLRGDQVVLLAAGFALLRRADGELTPERTALPYLPVRAQRDTRQLDAAADARAAAAMIVEWLTGTVPSRPDDVPDRAFRTAPGATHGLICQLLADGADAARLNAARDAFVAWSAELDLRTLKIDGEARGTSLDSLRAVGPARLRAAVESGAPLRHQAATPVSTASVQTSSALGRAPAAPTGPASAADSDQTTPTTPAASTRVRGKLDRYSHLFDD